jgi:hypothetical protein
MLLIIEGVGFFCVSNHPFAIYQLQKQVVVHLEQMNDSKLSQKRFTFILLNKGNNRVSPPFRSESVQINHSNMESSQPIVEKCRLIVSKMAPRWGRGLCLFPILYRLFDIVKVVKDEISLTDSGLRHSSRKIWSSRLNGKPV